MSDLEKQLAIISADPTRAKDQLALQKEIAKLREDLSWQIAEDEVKAQEKSIDQQLTSLEDYRKWIEDYYNNLLKYPAMLAEEMKKIFMDADAELISWAEENVRSFSAMTAAQQQVTIDRIHQLAYMTTEEMTRWMSEHVIGFSAMTKNEQTILIDTVKQMTVDGNNFVIDWLMRNNVEFQNATDTQKAVMIQGWRETMLQMRGATETYWDEVEDIIKGGDDAIIRYLRDNHPEYRKAGRLQAEAFVEAWREMLDRLKAAYRDTANKGIEEFRRLQEVTGEKSGNNGGNPSGGSPSGAGGGGRKYKVVSGSTTLKDGYDTEDAASRHIYLNRKTAENIFNEISRKMEETPGLVSVSQYRTARDNNNLWKNAVVKAYAMGGINDYTGLAMLHGTKSRPEAVLNADQTKAFKLMVEALTRITAPSIPRISDSDFDRNTSSFNIESITIQVDKLESDADYDEVANRVAVALQRRMTVKTGMPVGTIRL